ncbi:MAG TPA: hypothetical protein VKB78_05710 [Pirellulales bacterium]|nr:hypothetical protein [Pirellulales bacterium]
MKRRLFAVLFAGMLTASSAYFVPTVRADCPPYLFIQPNYAAYGQVLPAQPYAYGWFGVGPRQTWTWHWDYYGNRWIWR